MITALLLSVWAACQQAPAVSELWGEAGERWSPYSNLPDFSYAGYQAGESEIPMVPVTANLRDFGAVGDGETDDTQAFLDAIQATERGAIFVPAGRYKISSLIEIQKSDIVLRGSGPNRSTLVFTKPLNDIRPNWGATTSGKRTSNYSWSGGLVWIKGSIKTPVVTGITAPAKRGDTRLQVSKTQGLKVGQWVQILLRDDADKSLTKHLYSGDPGDISKHKGARVTLVTRLTDVSQNAISIERPLRCDVREEWQPVVCGFDASVRNVGIEDLGFEFPAEPYQGHFTELGFNALAMSNVVDCWAQNLRIKNCDSGMFISARFSTIRDVVFESDREPHGRNSGHHGIILGGSDNLFCNFDFRTRFIHDLGLSANHVGNVFADGKGVDLAFDHHKRAPYENLFTNIDVGAGNRTWHSGGGAALGKNCGARGTFWNIRADKAISAPPPNFAPSTINLIGIEGLTDVEEVFPLNLHQAQKQRRLQKRAAASRARPGEDGK